MKFKSSNAFSMVEVIVAAVIFTLAAAGVLAAISRARAPMSIADERLKAAAYGEQVLANLRSHISDGDSLGPYLNDGVHELPVSPEGYQTKYIVTTEPSGERRVDLNVTW